MLGLSQAQGIVLAVGGAIFIAIALPAFDAGSFRGGGSQ